MEGFSMFLLNSKSPIDGNALIPSYGNSKSNCSVEPSPYTGSYVDLECFHLGFVNLTIFNVQLLCHKTFAHHCASS